MRMRFLAVFVVGASALSAQGGLLAPPTNAKFAKLSEEFIHETLALSPSSASQAGYHQHVDPKTGKTIALDSLLDDMSPAGMARQRHVYAQWRERFHTETPVASLGAQDAADWRLIDDQIATEPAGTRPHPELQAQPDRLRGALGSALFQPLTDDYAPEGCAAGDMLSRVAATPTFLDQARSELLDADPIFIKVAVEENAGNVDLIQDTISAAVAKHPELKARFDQVAPPAVQGAEKFLAMAAG